MIAEGGEAPQPIVVEGKHVAATLLKDSQRANISSTEVARMMDLASKEGGKAGFQRETNIEAEAAAAVDFNDMQKAIDSLPTSPKKILLQNRKNAYEKILSDNERSLLGTETLEISKVVIQMPGFCDALATELGGGTTAQDIRYFLVPDPSHPVGFGAIEQQKVVDALNRVIANPQFKKYLKINLSSLSLPESEIEDQTNIDALRIETASKVVKETQRDTIQIQVDGYQTGHSEQKMQELDRIKQQIDALFSGLENAYRPASYSSINTSITTVDNEIKDIDKRLKGKLPADAKTELSTKRTRLREQKSALDQAKSIFNTGTNATEIPLYEQYLKNVTTVGKLNGELIELGKNETKLRTLEKKKEKYINNYLTGMDVALDHSVAQQWNLVVLRDAEQVAKLEAGQKSTEKSTNEEMAKFILEKYLRLHLLEFETSGKAKGWNKTKIEEYRKLLLSKSPADMMRVMVQNIYNDMGTMPATYQDELKAELKKIGIDTSTQFTDYVTNLDTKFLYGIAPENVAVTLGYSLASGNWITREKFSKADVEFLKINYGKDFWQKAFANQEQYSHVADEVGLGTLKLGDAFGRSFDGLLQKNPGEFFAKLLKLLSILGLVALLAGGVGLGISAIPH